MKRKQYDLTKDCIKAHCVTVFWDNDSYKEVLTWIFAMHYAYFIACIPELQMFCEELFEDWYSEYAENDEIYNMELTGKLMYELIQGVRK